MSEAQIVVIFLLFLVLAISSFILGWNLAVQKWRTKRQIILSNLERLEDQVNTFNLEREKDPQRGWTDIGSQYALVRMERTIAQVRAEIDGRREPTSD